MRPRCVREREGDSRKENCVSIFVIHLDRTPGRVTESPIIAPRPHIRGVPLQQGLEAGMVAEGVPGWI